MIQCTIVQSSLKVSVNWQKQFLDADPRGMHLLDTCIFNYCYINYVHYGLLNSRY